MVIFLIFKFIFYFNIMPGKRKLENNENNENNEKKLKIDEISGANGAAEGQVEKKRGRPKKVKPN